MRVEILDDMTTIVKLLSKTAKNIADLEDASKIAIGEAQRSSLENQKLKGRIATLERELFTLQEEVLLLKAQKNIVAAFEEAVLTPKVSTSDLMSLVNLAAEAPKPDAEPTQTSFSSRQGKKSGTFQLWSDAQDFPATSSGSTVLKRSKSVNLGAVCPDAAISPQFSQGSSPN